MYAEPAKGIRESGILKHLKLVQLTSSWWDNGYHHHSTEQSCVADHVQKPTRLFQLQPAKHKRSHAPPFNIHQLLRTEAVALAMPRLVPVLILIFLILVFETSSSQVQIIEDGIKPGHLLSKMHERKALGEITLDYDDGGPNGKHDPTRKGKPGNGGKNP